ncbi:transcription and mRNA export factor ENY2 [Cyprinus carpio]|uniref:Transcription and mRNA export factor ENY2 n=3 Tax=Cyprinoidei TaxID=30727 RepID=A0A9Q9X6M9_CYPCA|nr:transcription and mRNA export factor ENY2 [Cyprinus carpio]
MSFKMQSSENMVYSPCFCGEGKRCAERPATNNSRETNISRESQMRAAINQKLIEMGERERLKELLRAKLIECGWRDQLKALCKEVIKEKGIENVTVEDLVAGVTPKGRALVPDSVKKELLQRIRAFLAQHST